MTQYYIVCLRLVTKGYDRSGNPIDLYDSDLEAVGFLPVFEDIESANKAYPDEEFLTVKVDHDRR